MKIPKTIKVGQFIYKIKYVNDEIRNSQGDRLFAQARHYEREIVIDNKSNVIQTEESLIHEIIHCLDAVYKFSDKDLPESIIERLGTSLHKFIQDNPKIFK